MNDHERFEAHLAAFPDAGAPSPVCAIALLAAAILLAVGLAGVSPAPAQPADVRTLTIRVYASIGRLEDAVRELRTAKALDSRLMEARIVLGFVLLQLKRDADALSEFQDALQIDPRLGQAYVLPTLL